MNDDDSRLSAVFVAGWSRGLEDAARWHDIQANECIAVRDSARNKGEKNRHERARLTAVAATHADSAIKLRFKLRESP
jgi:superfamily I DNA/RNA helicase